VKKLYLVIFIFCLAGPLFGQVPVKPLAQAEFVRMLYDVERVPKHREEILIAIRTRGIGFEVTEGLRSLTRTKTRGDLEILRALEEAGRRRANPQAANLPNEKETLEILRKARGLTLEAVKEMPDFVVKQLITRSVSYAGTNNFVDRDTLVVAVSYRSDGREEYRVLSRDGVVVSAPQVKQNYDEVDGTTSTGEFVTVLAKIFEPESKTEFEFIDMDVVRNRRTAVYSYVISKENARQRITARGYLDDSTLSGVKGKIWIDRESSRVLRVENIATEIETGFPVTAASRLIDYDYVTINNEQFLLPSLSDVRLTIRDAGKFYETKNYIRFKDYNKFGSDVRILDEEEEVVDAKKKP